MDVGLLASMQYGVVSSMWERLPQARFLKNFGRSGADVWEKSLIGKIFSSTNKAVREVPKSQAVSRIRSAEIAKNIMIQGTFYAGQHLPHKIG